VVEWFKAL